VHNWCIIPEYFKICWDGGRCWAPPTYIDNSSLGVGVQNSKMVVQNGAKLVHNYDVERNLKISRVLLPLSWHRPLTMSIARWGLGCKI
jgi:hypothetical protein